MSIQQITYRYAHGKKWALVDENKHNITEYVYDGISYLTENLFKVCKKDKYGIIDDNGKLITDIEYDWLEKINEHCFSVRVDKYWGLINDKGDILLSIIYDQIYATPYRLKETSYIQIWKMANVVLLMVMARLLFQPILMILWVTKLKSLDCLKLQLSAIKTTDIYTQKKGISIPIMKLS